MPLLAGGLVAVATLVWSSGSDTLFGTWLLLVSHTEVSEGCALLETGTIFVDSFGFAYCPHAVHGGLEKDLGGGLYTSSFD